MGACLSCLGLQGEEKDSADRARLLYDDNHNVYGTWGGNAVPPPDHGITAEEERRLQHAWDGITQWAGKYVSTSHLVPVGVENSRLSLLQGPRLTPRAQSNRGNLSLAAARSEHDAACHVR